MTTDQPNDGLRVVQSDDQVLIVEPDGKLRDDQSRPKGR